MRKRNVALVGENDVQVTFTTKFKDLNGQAVETWDHNHATHYGQDVVDEERKAHKKALVKAKNFDPVKYKVNMIKRIEDNLAVLDEVQALLDEEKVT
ncbi:MAG TPA: hypothetical protein ENH31_00355 [Nitrospirae bacterium]|nr:hypothetical protein [Nitrospirota bacterium]HDK17142.1 hypothetical protein [Nitrospirota bacterium]HDK81003.1 hypothetical protein [Nitrospirota bacterium]